MTNNPATTILTGQVVYPNDPTYDEARANYNARFSIHPACMVFCESAADVSNAIKWSRENKQPFSVRCGRHSYEAFSLIENGLVIDISRMNGISIDTRGKTVSIQAGASLIEVYEKLWSAGKFTIPAGSCPTVGIAGLTLGGGFGLLSRKFGLTCDNVTEFEMVNAAGEIITANDEKNPDLFWALRGGGNGSFGVVTNIRFRVQQIDEVTIAKIYWKWSDLEKIVVAWQAWAPHTDQRLTSILALPKKETGGISFSCQFLGPLLECSHLLKKLFVCEPTSLSLNRVSFIEAVQTFAGLKEKKQHWSIHPLDHSKFKNTSHVTSEALSSDAVACMIENLERAPNGNQIAQLDAYGGAVNQIAKRASAFPHRRGTKFSIQYQSYWSDDRDESANIAWTDNFRKSMERFTKGGAYSNYCDVAIEDWQEEYYGSNFERLTKVKATYDPDNIFNFHQSIPVWSDNED